MKKFHYEFTATFFVNRELTEEELGQLEACLSAQIEEPADEFGNEVDDYTTDLLNTDIKLTTTP